MNEYLSYSLNKAIEVAWVEVNQDSQHRLRIHTRLNLYDAFIADMGVSISHLIKAGNTHFPHRTLGLKRFGYLGVITVEPLLPTWEQEMNRFERIYPGEVEPVRLFPYDILSTVRQLLRGKGTSEIVFDNKYWADMSDWHYVVGNLCDDVAYQPCMFLNAAYHVYTVTEGWLPFRLIHSELIESTYDEDLKTPEMENRDFTYHAWQANISEDPNPPGLNQQRNLPIKRDTRKALEFWRWWLFEAVPKAAMVDLSQLSKEG